MKPLTFVYLLFMSFVHIQEVKFAIPNQHLDLFSNYENQNFSQRILFQEQAVVAEIKNHLPIDSWFNHFLEIDTAFINQLTEPLKEAIYQCLKKSSSLKSYIKEIDSFFKDKISYSGEDIPQDPLAVLVNGKANCIGYTNLFSIFLSAARIKHRIIKGFFLKNENNDTFVPVPHRWIEIELNPQRQIFYDPQYHSFSANYLVVKDQVNFTSIKKFKIHLIKKNKHIIS